MTASDIVESNGGQAESEQSVCGASRREVEGERAGDAARRDRGTCMAVSLGLERVRRGARTAEKGEVSGCNAYTRPNIRGCGEALVLLGSFPNVATLSAMLLRRSWRAKCTGLSLRSLPHEFTAYPSLARVSLMSCGLLQLVNNTQTTSRLSVPWCCQLVATSRGHSGYSCSTARRVGKYPIEEKRTRRRRSKSRSLGR